MSNQFDNQPIFRSGVATDVWDIDLGLRNYMVKVYNYMAMGLGLTGIVSYLTASSSVIFNAIFGSPLAWLVVFAPVGMALFLSVKIAHLPLKTAQILFWVYSGLMGLSLSTVFISIQDKVLHGYSLWQLAFWCHEFIQLHNT